MKVSLIILLLLSSAASALEPNEILVIVNNDIEASVELGRYYCRKRNVPTKNILPLSLGKIPADTISREDYDKNIVEPIRKRLVKSISPPEIKCLLTTYGVPYKVGPRGPLKDRPEHLKQLETSSQQYEIELANIQAGLGAIDANEQEKIKKELAKVKGEIDRLSGRQTDASVDSELSMLFFDDYDLYRWQPNQLNKAQRYPADLALTLMVCRLDGPSPSIARGLVDKALEAERSAVPQSGAEKTGLKGVAYIDSRGIENNEQTNSFGAFDQKLRDLAILLRFRTNLEVKEEQTEKLFEPAACPNTAIYCGWYSLKKFVDSFEFVPGAIGIHVASLEAVNLRDANSTQWCPSMLVHGVTATFGAVAEPYLYAFGNPKDFFLELIEGKTLVEAYYRTQPYCSWQMVLIGDPLYKPFDK